MTATETQTVITLEMVRDTWGACYEADRLAALFERPLTPLDVLTRRDGAWSDVPATDRFWVVLHEGVLPDSTMRLFACACARRALERERSRGREPDHRSWAAVEIVEAHARGNATDKQLAAAWAAARDAARDWQLTTLVEMIGGEG